MQTIFGKEIKKGTGICKHNEDLNVQTKLTASSSNNNSLRAGAGHHS